MCSLDTSQNPSMAPHLKAWLGIIFASALLLRVAWVAVVIHYPNYVFDGDAREYYQLAMSLADGHGFAFMIHGQSGSTWVPTARRPPLYPAFAASVLAISGSGNAGVTAVLILQAITDSLTVLLVFGLVRCLAGERSAIIAAAGYAVYFYAYKFAGQFLSETLFIFLQTLAIFCLVRFITERPRFSRRAGTALSGLLLGLAALTRPMLILFPAFFVAWLLWRLHDKRKEACLLSAIILLAFALTLSPWAVRNRLALGKWVPVSTLGGNVFYHSNHAQSNGQWRPLPVPEEAKGLSETELDAYYYRKGMAFVLGHPLIAFKRAVLKVLRLYYPFYPEYDLLYGTVFLLAIPGAWLLLRKDTRTELLLLLVTYTTLLCAAFWGTPRFRMPIMPCFLACAGHYLGHHLWPRHADEQARKHILFTALAILLNLIIWVFAEYVRAVIKAVLG